MAIISKIPAVQKALNRKALNATTKTYDPNRRPSVLVGEINRKCPKLSAKADAWFVWVEFRDKKGVKGRLPDAIMAEPGFPRDKLEVADVRADGVLFTVKGNPYVNATLNAVRDCDGDPITVGKYVWLADSSDGVMREVVRIEGKKVYHRPEFGGPVTWDFGEDLIVNSGKVVAANDIVSLEIPLSYAARVQHAMRDAARTIRGVKMQGNDVLVCPDEDAADEAAFLLEQAGVPRREIVYNAAPITNGSEVGNSSGIVSKNAAVQKALNRKAANANTFDNTPIDRYVRDTICSKFPQSSLEGNTDGAVQYWTRGNGNKTILADKKARPALEALKAKFEPDYIFAHVDYGRGATGYSIKPRAHALRGEFKVANALTADDGEKQKEGERTFKECQKKIAAVRREVEVAKRRLEAKKNYYYTGELGMMIQYLKYAMWEE